MANLETLEFISIYGILGLQRKEATAMGTLRFTALATRPTTVPVPNHLAGDAHGCGDFTVGLAQHQKIDGILLLRGQWFVGG